MAFLLGLIGFYLGAKYGWPGIIGVMALLGALFLATYIYEVIRLYRVTGVFSWKV